MGQLPSPPPCLGLGAVAVDSPVGALAAARRAGERDACGGAPAVGCPRAGVRSPESDAQAKEGAPVEAGWSRPLQPCDDAANGWERGQCVESCAFSAALGGGRLCT